MFWGRGTDDGVIDEAFISHTIDWLPTHADLDQRTYEGLAHSISEVELSDAAAFIAKHFAAPAESPPVVVARPRESRPRPPRRPRRRPIRDRGPRAPCRAR